MTRAPRSSASSNSSIRRRPLELPAAVWARLRDLFAVDLRSLALLRIGLGVSVLADTMMRAFDLVGLYTDRGAAPRPSCSCPSRPGSPWTPRTGGFDDAPTHSSREGPLPCCSRCA